MKNRENPALLKFCVMGFMFFGALPFLFGFMASFLGVPMPIWLYVAVMGNGWMSIFIFALLIRREIRNNHSDLRTLIRAHFRLYRMRRRRKKIAKASRKAKQRPDK